MYIIKDTGRNGPECRGEIICKGKTRESAIKNFHKTNDWYEDEGMKVEIKEDLIYIDGSADYIIEKI